MFTAIGILIPFLGTSLGAFCVFFLKNQMNQTVQRMLLGLASGVMVAASIWSLLLPAIESVDEMGRFAFVPAAIGFLLGFIILISTDLIVVKLEDKVKAQTDAANINNYSDISHTKNSNTKNSHTKNSLLQTSSRSTVLLTIAVTLHNIPEGMAVGVVFAGLLAGEPNLTASGAMITSVGIAIQNIPEGAVISMPLLQEGQTKFKSFIYGVLSGIVEPIAAGLTLLLCSFIAKLLPYLLSFAAGAMMFVVSKELLPEASENEKSYLGAIGFAIGFLIMMSLDVALG